MRTPVSWSLSARGWVRHCPTLGTAGWRARATPSRLAVGMERHDDEAILAALGAEPDGFALLYWRYAGEILDELARCTGDAARAGELCAEAFAVALDRAHRYDPARGPVADWLYAIARRLLDQAERRGAVAGGAQRRLGMAPFRLMGADGCDALSASDAGLRFMRELEEELV